MGTRKNSARRFGSGSTVTANLLAGGIDEYFMRTDENGARSFLIAALGSTVALTDSSGAVQTQYSYEPFGRTIASGVVTTSTFEFTGRENDGTGLYYNRARYYNPALQRFISEDPLGIGGGVNAYAYVTNAPTGFSDLMGLDKQGPNWQQLGLWGLAGLGILGMALGPEEWPLAGLGMEAAAGEAAGTEAIAIAGHGIESAFLGTTIVPEGTAITIPGTAGLMLPNSLGLAMEAGQWEAIAQNGAWMELMEGSATYLPGAAVPNLQLGAASGLTTLSGSITVAADTLLSELLNMHGPGVYIWAACRWTCGR